MPTPLDAANAVFAGISALAALVGVLHGEAGQEISHIDRSRRDLK